MWLTGRQRARAQAKLLLNREAQRREQPLPLLAADPDYQRLCRVMAEVIRESVGSPDLKLDPALLRPTDVWWGDLDFDLDSLAHMELACALEKEFHRGLTWRQFQETATILDLYQLLFPERGIETILLPEV